MTMRGRTGLSEESVAEGQLNNKVCPEGARAPPALGGLVIVGEAHHSSRREPRGPKARV